MRKQLRKALSMVLSAAMAVALGSGVDYKAAGAVNAAKSFEASLTVQDTSAWDEAHAKTSDIIQVNKNGRKN